MYPLLMQTDLFSTEFIQAVGVPSFVAVIATLIVLLIVYANARREKTDAETQSTVTQLVPTLAAQIGELQKETNRLHGKLGDLQQRNADEREKRIRLEEEYKRDKEVSAIKLTQMDNTLKQHQRKIAQLEMDKQSITEERNRYRNERDKLADQVIKQKERITILETNVSILTNQNDEYKRWQQKEDTQRLPDLPDVEDATINNDGNLTTPVITQAIKEASNSEKADDSTNTDDKLAS